MELLNKFPSYDRLVSGAIAAFGRFPLVFLSAVFATVVGIILIESSQPQNEDGLVRVLMAAILGVPWFFSLTVFSEKRRWRAPVAFGLQAGGLIILAAYYLSLPENVTQLGAPASRFLVLNVGLHFLVACLPYMGGSQVRGFWQYNKALFIHFLIAGLYAGVLYIGLTIALAAADHLFGMDVKSERYAQLWIMMAGFCHPLIFLAGVPEDLERLNDDYEFPKGLGVFAQYILLPLVALYFVILIAYEAKIVVTWNWPKGWVSNLVLWYSVVGILSLLLLHPLRERPDRRWIQVFTNWYFRALVPLVIMLFFAIARRISDYGITEPRYFVMAMAIGLDIVTLYFVFSKVKDIRIVPVFLAAIAFLSAYGPWSAFAVSLKSQQGRLEALLVQSEILVDGTIQTAPDELPFEIRKEMSSIISYLSEWHGLEPFSRWLDDSMMVSLDSVSKYYLSQEVAETMGFDYVGPYARLEAKPRFSISDGGMGINVTSFVVTGYDYLVDFSLVGENDFLNDFLLDTDSCFVKLDDTALVLEVGVGSDRDNKADAVRFPLSETLDSLVATYRDNDVPLSDCTFVRSGDNYEIKLVLKVVNGEIGDEGLQVEVFGGHLLLRKR